MAKLRLVLLSYPECPPYAQCTPEHSILTVPRKLNHTSVTPHIAVLNKIPINYFNSRVS